MSLLSILLLGLAMSTDAFAAALARGAGMPHARWPQALRTGLVFGVVEGATPVIGWLLGSAAARYVQAWDHWIAFVLLVALGLHLIWKAKRGSGRDDDAGAGEAAARKTGLIATTVAGLATSIDAMAVGVGLAFVDVNIALVAVVIGVCTFTLVSIGVMAGRALGTLIGKRAEIAGGIILILVGAVILYEHTLAKAA